MAGPKAPDSAEEGGSRCIHLIMKEDPPKQGEQGHFWKSLVHDPYLGLD